MTFIRTDGDAILLTPNPSRLRHVVSEELLWLGVADGVRSAICGTIEHIRSTLAWASLFPDNIHQTKENVKGTYRLPGPECHHLLFT